MAMETLIWIVPIQNFFRSLFPVLEVNREIDRVNTDREILRIWTFFTQYESLISVRFFKKYTSA